MPDERPDRLEPASEAIVHFREIGDATPVMMWATDASGRFVWFNRNWLEFTGQSLEQAISVGRSSCVHEEDQESLEIASESSSELRDSLQIEYRLRNAAGDFGWVMDRSGPRFDEHGDFSGYIGVCIDISGEIEYRQRLAQRDSVMQQLHAISERERSFLACAIHDGLLQDIIGSDMLVQGVHGMDPAALTKRVNQIRETLRSAISHGRRLISELRPMILDEQGLASAVEYYAAEIENRSSINIRVESNLSRKVSLTFWRGNVFRIIQEALNNVETHSRSPNAEVILDAEGERFKATVRDFGVGFDSSLAYDSFGLRCMRERAEIYGGTIQISSNASGTTVVIEVPIPKMADVGLE